MSTYQQSNDKPAAAVEVTTPVGRLVGGHPMDAHEVKDDAGNPKLDKISGQPRRETFLAVAFAKGAESGWWDTDWGKKIFTKGQQDWPGGEWQRQDFAWKVEDGDSMVPNKRGKKNGEREGYPGHWILKFSTGLGIKCYNAGHYDPLEQLQDNRAIKPGDYCRVVFTVRGNAPSQSPGVYVNPQLFELSQVGQAIILEGGPSAADTFGAGAPQIPANAQQGAPTAMPGAPTAMPGAPAAMPGAPTAMPGAPAAMPGAPAAMPGAPAAMPGAPAAMPGAPAAPQSNVQQAPDFLNPQAPAPQAQAPAPQAQAPAPQAQAPAPEEKFNLNGVAYTRAQLHDSKWTDEAINQLPRA